MEHRYNLESVFKNFLSLRGIPYLLSYNKSYMDYSKEYNDMKRSSLLERTTSNGTPYRNNQGFYMPVSFKAGGSTIELPYAVISISQKKNIVSTPLQGRVKSVKELISMNDADIDLTGMLVGDNGNYPEQAVSNIRGLFETNKSIEIICPLTDIILGIGVEVVIESINYLPIGGIEDAQAIRMKLITDQPFELCIS